MRMKPIPRHRLQLSFSGGATSGFMTKWCLDNLANQYEIVVTFSNTGEEDGRTLAFVDRCDRILGFKTVWLEAVVHPEHGVGTTHKVVTYETATRGGSLFEAAIRKYGIHNKTFPHCTRTLKLQPMTSYLRSIGWEAGSYTIAIGIRTDETRRVAKTAEAQNIIYPLIDLEPMDKQDVREWWEEQSFQVGLPEHRGNCTWCWKKSLRKHLLLLKDDPNALAFPDAMEQQYGAAGAWFLGVNRVFFREKRSARDIIKIAAITDPTNSRTPALDDNGGCSESCEIYDMAEQPPKEQS
jgi:hypothetical protein